MKKLRQVVLVDDNELSGLITRLLLENFGFADSVVVFYEPEKALDYFASLMNSQDHERVLPELLLTDFHMIGMTGLEMIWRLRRMGLSANVTRCIILSGSAELMDPLLLERNGVDGQLIKPLDKNLLKRYLQEANLQPVWQQK